MLNRLILMGRLTADPELKTTQSGVNVTTFTLAVERNYVAKGQDRQTDFVRCVAWRNTADFICKYFSKGRMMSVEAELQSRSYENSEGRKVTVWEAVVSNVYFCGDTDRQENGETTFENYEEAEIDDDELPF